MDTKSILLIWWNFYWKATLLGFLIGAVTGFFVGIVMGIFGQPLPAMWVWQTVGFLTGIPISMLAFLSAMKHNYKRLEVVIRYKEDRHDLDNEFLSNRPT
ncbi:MAG: hypothetical protein Hens2KO_11860 [Henriciella sp.]